MVLHGAPTDERKSGVERPARRHGRAPNEPLLLKGLVLLEHTHLLLEKLALLQTLAFVFLALLFNTLDIRVSDLAGMQKLRDSQN